MLEMTAVEPFLGTEVGVLHTDCGKDFFLKGTLLKVSENTLLIENPVHGKTLISLDAVKKIKEMKDGSPT